MEERLDKIIMQRQLVSTRVRAEEIIKRHGVIVNGKLHNKPGKKIPVDATIELLEEEIPYVSRGALKLKHAFEKFKLNPSGKVVLDIGASTGGFTQLCLENDASKVYCVDVGTGQLHPSLIEDSRVVNLEKTHVRELTDKLLPEKADFLVVDVSFISLEKIFPFIHNLVKENGECVVLVKPQFEVGKENVGKGGIVKNKKLYPIVIEKIQELAQMNHLKYLNHIDSPILGGDGNWEFLMHLRKC
jgi:23S rRNA (cytidine1920-2'-O)/16S rRNA (cytidine1409-2'-O)-methyltransferase